MNVLDALTGMLAAPVRTLRAIAKDGANPVAPIALLVVAVVVAEAKALQRLLFLLGDGGEIIVRRIRDDVFVADLRTHVAVLVAACVVAAALAWLLGKRRVSPKNAAVAAVYLVVPLVALMFAGTFLDGVGVPAWFMPQAPVDGMAVVVGREVSWLRFVVKCVVAYGPPLALGLTLVPWFVAQAKVPESGAAEMPASPSSGRAPSTKMRAIGGGALAALFALAIVGAGVSSAKYAQRIRPTLPGDALPDVALRKLDEFGVQKEKTKPSLFVGHVLVLDFWASWCGPCRRSMPELSRIYDAHKAEGLVVLGINREPEDPKAARKALQEIKPSFDCAIDERGYGERLGLTSLPTSYIVDKHGVVRHLHLGYTEPDVVESEIKALLAE